MRAIRMLVLLTSINLIPAGLASPSDEWNLRRNTGNGACSVQPADSAPQLGTLLATHPTRKAACQDALTRHTDDASDTSKCFAYTKGTKDACKADGIQLPD
jgi:hypothetical protein